MCNSDKYWDIPQSSFPHYSTWESPSLWLLKDGENYYPWMHIALACKANNKVSFHIPLREAIGAHLFISERNCQIKIILKETGIECGQPTCLVGT